jgi:hypothetical protein
MTAYASRIAVLALVALPLAAPVPTSAQSLADVARASNAKKQEAPKPAKVYTNDNLRQDITASTPTAPADATPDAAASAAAAPADPAPAADAGAAPGDSGARDEKYWRGRMAAARDGLARAGAFATALQSQINALTTDFINRDDPVQRAAIEQQRTKAVAELERVQREVESAKKAIAAVEEDARKAGVPAGWLR